jgi:unconventional prefoldin RPB5 interactor 1
MSASIEQSLERHRQRLEESLEKLKKALRHWQISSAEYEALREELQALPEDASREDMVSILSPFLGFASEGCLSTDPAEAGSWHGFWRYNSQ